jgi:hypothetical protein
VNAIKIQFSRGIVIVVAFVGHAPAQQISFVPAPGSPIAVAGGPGNVAIGDVNQDGKPDLVVASGRTRNMTILFNQGNARFRAAHNSPVSVPDSPGEMALADINADRKLDLVLASHDSYGVMLLLGDGNGGFTLASNSPIVMKDGQRPHTHGLAVGEVNGDGKLDLVTANNEDNDVCVALGDGRGGFIRAPGSPFGVGKSPYPFALGDVNADGHLDIVATSTAPSSRELTLLLGDGQGGFRRNEVALRTNRPWYVAIGDVNGDDKHDLVTTHSERSSLTVLLGDGKGSFTESPGSPFDLGHAAWRVAIVDVNRDAKADVVAAADKGVRVLLGDARGSFKPAPGSPFATGKGAWRLAVGDLDSDGKLDIATSNLESDNVSILLAR